MHGIYTYIPETNCVPMEYNVAAILLLLFMVLISLVSVFNLLYFYISTFRSMCVQCPIWLFSVVPSLHVFPVSCSRIFWITLKQSQSPLLLPVSPLFLHSTCAVFLFYGGVGSIIPNFHIRWIWLISFTLVPLYPSVKTLFTHWIICSVGFQLL